MLDLKGYGHLLLDGTWMTIGAGLVSLAVAILLGLRGAILAVPKGQLEAARAVGMSRFLVVRRVLLPQMWRFAIPGLGNTWLVLLKATSLMSVVGLDELTRKSYVAAGATKLYLEFF